MTDEQCQAQESMEDALKSQPPIQQTGDYVSDCCGAAPRSINNDCDTMDFGLCPICHEHCEYVPEGE